MRKSSILFLLAMIGLITAAFAMPAFAQSGAMRAGSIVKKRSRAEERKERQAFAKYKKSITPAKNAAQQKQPTTVLPLVHSDVSLSLDQMVKIARPLKAEDGPIFENKVEPTIEIPDSPLLKRQNKTLPATRPFVQTTLPNAPSALVPGTSFEGPGSGIGGFTIFGAPPDTTMAVGPNHIVAWVNSQLMIFDKSGNQLLPAPGFVNGNTIWAGFGGLCETTNRGDPLVAYDRQADRWVFSQFAFNVSGGNPATPYLQCFAVSQGSNPAGPYNRYSYDFSTAGPGGIAEFNDYGKLGVWYDAYYAGYNAFQGSPAGSNNGALICAYERSAMVAGTAAKGLCAPVAFYAGGASVFPADNQDSDQPADQTRGGLFMRQNLASNGQLRIMRLLPDFNANTVTINNGYGGATGSSIDLPITLTRACNGSGGTCIPQTGTTNTLDTLGSRLMYRINFRKVNGIETLFVMMSADPDGAGTKQSGVAWFEIRNPLNDPAGANPPTIYQSGIFTPDTTDRWMPSGAINDAGDILLSYSASSSSINPGLRVAARQANFSAGVLGTELVAQAGAGSQTGTLTRWGDYTTTVVDPSDDKTFWSIGQYLSANGTFNWRTRIYSYKFSIPTAAGVTVAGRVLNNFGVGLRNARVTLTDSAGKAVTVLTNAFGYYSFSNVQSGGVYFVAAEAKGYSFTPRFINVTDTLTDVDLTPAQ